MAKLKVKNVGDLRKLIAKLPDDAGILPDWATGAPGDDEPGIQIHGFKIKKEKGTPYLSVLVSLFYLDG